MKLKRIVEQADAAAQYYDFGKDYSSLVRSMNMAEETVKNRFEQAIAAKLKSKKIRARASRGYKQFEKDYDINVASVSVDDYYDNYVVVVRGANGKEYFLKPGFKIQILGAAEAEQPQEPKAPKQPKKPKAPPAQPPSQAPSQTPTQAPAVPQAPEQQVKEMDGQDGGTEIVRKYPVESIEKDVALWLPKLLMRSDLNLKEYIPQHGVSRTKGRRTVATYGITIPTDELPGLSADQIKAELSQAGKMGDIEQIYTLEKFDVRGSKYVIIIKKIMNY